MRLKGFKNLLRPLKAAWIALAIIGLLTASKFGLYLLSGSISVLSEAWHCLMDIATTLLVLISIIRQEYKNKKQAATPADVEDTAAAHSMPRSWNTFACKYLFFLFQFFDRETISALSRFDNVIISFKSEKMPGVAAKNCQPP